MLISADFLGMSQLACSFLMRMLFPLHVSTRVLISYGFLRVLYLACSFLLQMQIPLTLPIYSFFDLRWASKAPLAALAPLPIG